VAIGGPSSLELVATVVGVWLREATVTILPHPSRLGSNEAALAELGRRLELAQPALSVIDGCVSWPPAVWEASGSVVTTGEVVVTSERCPAIDAPETSTPGADGPALLQFTSGSTGRPRGLVVRSSQLRWMADVVARGAQADLHKDVWVSWLPLYHDMGLVGLLLTPMLNGIELVLLPTEEFVRRPRIWIDTMAAFGGTFTAAPNFAYALMKRHVPHLDSTALSRCRIALSGGEQIHPETMRGFVRGTEPLGLHARAPFCAYGLAEATLAVSMPDDVVGMSTDRVDRHALEVEGVARPSDREDAVEFAELGTPVRDTEVVIRALDGTQLGRRTVGQIWVRGPGVVKTQIGPEGTIDMTDDEGWIPTGDLGYLADNELVVTSRLKDIVTINGRAIGALDIEICAAVEGVRPGGVVAFGVPGLDGSERIVIVAEARSPTTRGIPDRVRHAVGRRLGLPVEDVLVFAARQLPKTTSGKLRRSYCRGEYVAGRLASMARPT
jgi:fatty-acyl-CoA synthase